MVFLIFTVATFSLHNGDFSIPIDGPRWCPIMHGCAFETLALLLYRSNTVAKQVIMVELATPPNCGRILQECLAMLVPMMENKNDERVFAPLEFQT